MWRGKRDTTRNISCSITFSSTFHDLSRKFFITFLRVNLVLSKFTKTMSKFRFSTCYTWRRGVAYTFFKIPDLLYTRTISRCAPRLKLRQFCYICYVLCEFFLNAVCKKANRLRANCSQIQVYRYFKLLFLATKPTKSKQYFFLNVPKVTKTRVPQTDLPYSQLRYLCLKL